MVFVNIPRAFAIWEAFQQDSGKVGRSHNFELDVHLHSVSPNRTVPFFSFLGEGFPLNSTNQKRMPFFSPGHCAAERASKSGHVLWQHGRSGARNNFLLTFKKGA